MAPACVYEMEMMNTHGLDLATRVHVRLNCEVHLSRLLQAMDISSDGLAGCWTELRGLEKECWFSDTLTPPFLGTSRPSNACARYYHRVQPQSEPTAGVSYRYPTYTLNYRVQ